MSTCEAKKDLVLNTSDFSETKVHETTSQNNCHELINPNRGTNEENNIVSYNYCQSKMGHIYGQAKWTMFTLRQMGHIYGQEKWTMFTVRQMGHIYGQAKWACLMSGKWATFTVRQNGHVYCQAKWACFLPGRLTWCTLDRAVVVLAG